MKGGYTNTHSTTRLSELIEGYLSTRKPTTILITGPSGSGKTSLLQQCEFSTLPVHNLHTDTLTNPEQLLLRVFQRPAVIKFDNIDLYAPPKPGISETRLIAALLHALSYSPALFISTATNDSAIHPAVREKLEHDISLDALSLQERLEAARHLGRYASTIAELTPGFLWADMRNLFTRLSGIPESELHEALPRILQDVRPALLIGQEVVSREQKLHGLEAQQRQLQEILRAVFPESGDSTPARRALDRIGSFRGVLIHGSTGCGKTALARIGNTLVRKHTVNFMEISATEVVGSVIGAGERKLRQVFLTARAIAPCVVIIDNIDIIAPRRGDGDDGSGVGKTFGRVLSTLLVLIDGVVKDDRRVLVIGTTRDLRLIDDALLRPGRFDLHIPVDAPDAEARVKILGEYLNERGMTATEIGIDDAAFMRVSQRWTAAEVKSYARKQVLHKKAKFI